MTQGYGKDLKARQVEGRLYHKCTWEGLDELLSNYKPHLELSTSTEESVKLFGREICVVFDARVRDCQYTPYDSDSGKQHGYDEARVNFESAEELINQIETIVVKPGTIEEIENSEDEDNWKWDILENNYSLFQEKGDDFYNLK